ncbi:hypothetical protein E4T39_06629 [Aureobasidium subglaciale]|nr:hypothetical protein E4T39_06629 [Aureobasidium subglaciale]
MRYNDWDAILFPQTSSIPIQEFCTEFFDIITPGKQVVLAMHVAVDGNIIVIDTINPDGNFPQKVIDLPTRKLRFPPFHEAVGNQLQLHIPDNLGRITVGLSEGYFYEAHGGTRFNPIKDVVSFKWVHAPKHVLRDAGILWPHPRVLLGHEHVPHMSFPVGDQSMSSQTSSQVPIETGHFNSSDFTS